MKGLDTTFFNLSTQKRPLSNGDLLLAEPFLNEAWFRRAVISLIDTDRNSGSTGVVLNNPMNYKLPEVLDGVNSDVDVPVFCGGPLSHDRLYFLHTLGPEIIPDGRLYAPGLYIGGDFDSAIAYVNEGYPYRGCIRFFIGYSGWEPGQLADEISRDVWAPGTSPADPALLLTANGDAMWQQVLRTLGPHYRSWQLIPADLHAN